MILTPTLLVPPRVMGAWHWLAAQAGDLRQERQPLIAVLQAHAERGIAALALLVLDRRSPTS